MAVADKHRVVLGLEASEIATKLQETLGQKLVAYMVGVSDPVTVGRWANERSNPTTANADRLREIYQITEALLEVDPPNLVRAWFVGMNPELSFRPPATLIAEGEAVDVMAVAQNFARYG